MRKFLRRLFKITAGLFLLTLAAAAVGAWYIDRHYGADLPDHQWLAQYEPAIASRVYAGDGRLMAAFAREDRIFVPIGNIPDRVAKAFISAEDKTFYQHFGLDVPGIASALITNVVRKIDGKRPVGASTITQQVAKNMLLSNELSFDRKIKEALLALRLERSFSKDRILELYLNEIFLGNRSYGVAAAALNYFDKSLDELTVGEAAMLAALPKAPSTYDPARNPMAAKERRDWVIGQMRDNGYITPEEAQTAMAEPITLRQRAAAETVSADYFSEELRREITAKYGEKSLYEGGLAVHATLDPKLQAIADRVLREGLERYDRRHGYRGPLAHIEGADQETKFDAFVPPPGSEYWDVALVTAVTKEGAQLRFKIGKTGILSPREVAARAGGQDDPSIGVIPLAELKWARRVGADGRPGPAIAQATDALSAGDVVLVDVAGKDDKGKDYPPGTYALKQIPEIGGAIVAMDPHTGRVLAMTGGWSQRISQFNRATQAWRQPGSSSKPFTYMAALDNGYTPATLVLDAPVVIDQGPGLPKWRPQNYSGDYLGLVPLRVGIEKSRNLMTVRLAQAVGMPKVEQYFEKLGVVDHLDPVLSMSLGAGETTVLRMTAAYSMIVNGGKQITPTMIDWIQDRRGRTIYSHDQRPCEQCKGEAWNSQTAPELTDNRAQILDPITAYQMVSMMQGVVERGTGTAIKAVGKPLAGKTGTTNDSHDTWFVGFSPDLVAGIYFGFDTPRSLGEKETGGSTAAFVFRDFMKEALADKAAVPFRVPPGVSFVWVDRDTGQMSSAGAPNAILEAFKPGTEPTGQPQILDGYTDPTWSSQGGTGTSSPGFSGDAGGVY